VTETSALVLQIDADLKQAMRDRNEVVKLTLRSLKTALTEAAKASEDHTLDDGKVVAILQKEAKQRRDSAAEYEKAGDAARAAQELAEVGRDPTLSAATDERAGSRGAGAPGNR
jgi:uncharacterized protein YqeY